MVAFSHLGVIISEAVDLTTKNICKEYFSLIVPFLGNDFEGLDVKQSAKETKPKANL